MILKYSLNFYLVAKYSTFGTTVKSEAFLATFCKAKEFEKALEEAHDVIIREDRLLVEGWIKLDVNAVNMAKATIAENCSSIKGFIRFLEDLKEKLSSD